MNEEMNYKVPGIDFRKASMVDENLLGYLSEHARDKMRFHSGVREFKRRVLKVPLYKKIINSPRNLTVVRTRGELSDILVELGVSNKQDAPAAVDHLVGKRLPYELSPLKYLSISKANERRERQECYSITDSSRKSGLYVTIG